VGSVGGDAVATIAADLRRAFRQGRGRVGLVAPLPYSIHAGLLGALPGVELVDAARGFRELRLRKSPEEVAWTRRAAGLCDLAMAALVDAARPGIRDDELVAVVEGAYRSAGGEHGICFLASVPMRGGGRIVPAQYPARRRIRSGDAIVIELSAGLAGFTGQVLRTIAVGDPPPPFRRLHLVAEEAFASIAALVRPGTTAAELLEAGRLIDRAGMTVVDDVIHGYGGGYLPPVLRTPATQTRPVPDMTLEPGMMLVVQPNVVSADRRKGVQTGELLVVSDAGHERLHKVPAGLLSGGH
jgi:Xaa-Pro aminopeptidase